MNLSRTLREYFKCTRCAGGPQIYDLSININIIYRQYLTFFFFFYFEYVMGAGWLVNTVDENEITCLT